MSLKKNIKKLLTFWYHPLVTIALLKRGNRDFVIGPRGRINNLKHLTIGVNTEIGNDVRMTFVEDYWGGVYTPNCVIGNNCSIGNRFTILCADKVIISDNNLIASDVLVASENHGIELEKSKSYSSLPLTSKPVFIKEGCWIGEKVVILPGVTIGKRSIIGASSVVTKSIPDYSIAVGNPAHVIKKYDFGKQKWVAV